MEVYRGTTPTLIFEHPTNNTSVSSFTYTVNDGDEETATVVKIPDPINVGKFIASKVTLPYQQHDGVIKTIWEVTVGGGSFTEQIEYNVVTPLLSLSEVKKIIESTDDEEATIAERAARYIINAYCGQTFGKYVGKLSISGNGESFLRLPMKLLSLTDINDNTYWNQTLAIRGNGWFLTMKNYGVPTVRADYEGWHQNPNVPISAPSVSHVGFISNVEYNINGVWGWEQVPNAVREAARLLVNDYACGESIYRDRFLTSMTAADWRIQFNDRAFTDTGNVRANQLLADYVAVSGWMIL